MGLFSEDAPLTPEQSLAMSTNEAAHATRRAAEATLEAVGKLQPKFPHPDHPLATAPPAGVSAEVSDVPSEQPPQTTVAIPSCPRCRKAHYGQRVNAYVSPESSAPWTHWFLCPATGEPVSLYVAVDGVDHPGTSPGLQIDSQIVSHMVDAQASGQWLAVIFYVQGGKLLMHRKNDAFPRGDFPKAVEMFRDNVAGEYGPPPLKELPVAADLEPVVQLFGNR